MGDFDDSISGWNFEKYWRRFCYGFLGERFYFGFVLLCLRFRNLVFYIFRNILRYTKVFECIFFVVLKSFKVWREGICLNL